LLALAFIHDTGVGRIARLICRLRARIRARARRPVREALFEVQQAASVLFRVHSSLLSSLPLSAQRSEARANLVAEELRLLPGGEVPALVEPVVVDQFGVRPLGPTPGRRIEFVREDAHGNRDGDAFDAEKGELAEGHELLPVETGRGYSRI